MPDALRNTLYISLTGLSPPAQDAGRSICPDKRAGAQDSVVTAPRGHGEPAEGLRFQPQQKGASTPTLVCCLCENLSYEGCKGGMLSGNRVVHRWDPSAKTFIACKSLSTR